MKSHGAIVAAILSNAKGSEAKGEILQAIQRALPENPEIADAVLTKEIAQVVMSGDSWTIREKAQSALGAVIGPYYGLARHTWMTAKKAVTDPGMDARMGAQTLLRVVVKNHPLLAAETLDLAKTGVSDDLMTVRLSSLWTLGEIGRANRDLARQVSRVVKNSLKDSDPTVASAAACVLETIKAGSRDHTARPAQPVARRPGGRKMASKKTAQPEWRGYAIF